MRKFLLLFASLVSSMCLATTEYYLFSDNGVFIYEYGCVQDFTTSGCTVSQFIDNELVDIASVQKPWSLMASYSYHENDELLASHYSYFRSPGTFLSKRKEFYVFDQNDCEIGRIQGQYTDEYAAQFVFYQDGNEFAIATLSNDYSSISIFTPDGQGLYECNKTFKEYNSTYYWHIEQLSDDYIDDRFLWPFLSFIQDVWWMSG